MIVHDRTRLIGGLAFWKIMKSDTKIGLAIQGGAMRTMYCAGAIRYLIESGISRKINAISGSSGGIISGLVLLASDHDSEYYAKMIDEIFSKVATKQFIDIKRLSCIVDVDFLVNTTFDVLDMEKLRRALQNTELHISMTDTDAKTEYAIFNGDNFDIDQLRAAVVATMAIPGLYRRKAVFNGKRYFDGGIDDPLPLLHTTNVKNITDAIAIATVPAGKIGDELASGMQAMVLRSTRSIPDQILKAISTRSSLGDMTDQIVERGNYSGVNVYGILPKKSLGALTNINHKHLRELEKQGYDDAQRLIVV